MQQPKHERIINKNPRRPFIRFAGVLVFRDDKTPAIQLNPPFTLKGRQNLKFLPVLGNRSAGDDNPLLGQQCGQMTIRVWTLSLFHANDFFNLRFTADADVLSPDVVLIPEAKKP